MKPDQERQEEIVEFSKKVQLIAQAALSVLTLTGLVTGALTWFLMRPLRAEAGARVQADSLINQRLDRLTRIAELQATFTLEPDGSPERARALEEFRRMRRITP